MNVLLKFAAKALANSKSGRKIMIVIGILAVLGSCGGGMFAIGTVVVGGVLSVFSFGGHDELSDTYKKVSNSTGVEWADMAAYDAIRTDNTFEDVDTNSIRQTADKFTYVNNECITDKDEHGNPIKNKDGTYKKTCNDVTYYYTLEEVLQREQKSADDIDYALYVRDNLPLYMGELDDDGMIEIDPEVIANNKFIWPVPAIYRVSDPYGMRVHPITHEVKLHTGIDLSNAKEGSPILASSDGTVYQIRHDTGGCGNWVRLKHEGGYTTKYCHMQSVAVSEKTDGKPTEVEKGQIIGYVGQTGDVTGPHLHFEIAIDGATTDPYPFIEKTRPQGDGS